MTIDIHDVRTIQVYPKRRGYGADRIIIEHYDNGKRSTFEIVLHSSGRLIEREQTIGIDLGVPT